MGGRIICVSEVGKGTEFRISIPFKTQLAEIRHMTDLSYESKTIIHKEPSAKDLIYSFSFVDKPLEIPISFT
jgi:hypothetical protein